MPYRESYLDGTSGVLVQSALSGKPICVPNIRPFNEIVREFGIGTSFAPNDSAAVANALMEIDVTENATDYRGHWEDYLRKISSWEEIASAYLLDKK
jgi:glycosyltransferase involved in cell wall biosynthesis